LQSVASAGRERLVADPRTLFDGLEDLPPQRYQARPAAGATTAGAAAPGERRPAVAAPAPAGKEL